MCFLYILPWLHKNAFKRVLQCSIRIGFGSGGAWHWFCAFAAAPGLLPSYSQRDVPLAFCSTPVCQIMQGGGTFAGSWWWSVSDRLAIPGTVTRWGKGTKKVYDKSEIASNPDRFELGKSEKNRRNLKLIQTCDFFIFVHYVYISL